MVATFNLFGSLRLNPELLDERPKFLDTGLLQRAQCFRALLVVWNNLLPEIGQSRSRSGVSQSIDDGSIELTSGRNAVRIWADTNRPTLHIEMKLEHPAIMKATLELWRTTTHPYDQPSPDRGGLFELGNREFIAIQAGQVGSA